MAELDKDLLSIQEARTLATQARDAQRQFAKATQAEVDRICAAMAQAAADASGRHAPYCNAAAPGGVVHLRRDRRGPGAGPRREARTRLSRR